MARSPLVIDITPLKRQPGAQRRLELTISPPGGAALESAEVAATAVHIDMQLEVAGEELIAQGAVKVDWTGPCRRCLEEQAGTTTVETREIFQRKPIEGETYYLDENDVDLEPMLRETVLLNLPVAPLCGDDCAGPDPSRFPTTVVKDADPDEEPPADPRWAALSEITFDE